MVAAFICIFPVLVRAAFSFSVFFPGRQDLFDLICGSFCRVHMVVLLFRTRYCQQYRRGATTSFWLTTIASDQHAIDPPAYQA